MLNLAPEVLDLEREGRITPQRAGVLVAEERREIVSMYAEVRALAWIGVMLIAGGVGVIVSKNLDRIGPVTIAVAIFVASAACYAYAVERRASARRGMLDEYVLLLGALILSADVGYIEHQFHLLGAEWPRHFLLLALIHGVAAYFFDSAALVSLSVAALASWFGIERNVNTFFTDSIQMAGRAFVCSVVVGVWRFANRREGFTRVFDHFALNLALWGGLILTFNGQTTYLGLIAVLVISIPTILYGFRQRTESFVIYAYVYAVIAIVYVLVDFVGEPVIKLAIMTLAIGFAVAGLYLLHDRFKRSAR